LIPSTYGCYFEDLEPGQKYRHWPGRTITEFDDTLFSLLSMNQHPVHIDEHFASGTQHGQRLVEGPIVISLVIGISQRDIGGRAMETLGYSDVRHAGPVFHGDTIYAESTVLEKRDDGTVTVEHRGLNQRGELVLTMSRKIVLPRRLA
jgi:acyl dehydratase